MAAKKYSIRSGTRIPLPTRRTMFSLSYWGFVVRALNALLNLKVQSGETLDLKISDDNSLLTVPEATSASPSTPSEFWYPFKIYTDPTATEPANTFAVRAGLVGFRSRFSAPYDWDASADFPSLKGRAHEREFLVQDGTDRVGTVPYIDFSSTFVNPGYTTTVLEVTGNATFTGVGKSIFHIDIADSGNYSDGGYLACGFWILVTDSTDDSSSPTFQVQARLFAYGGTLAGFASDPWPTGDTDTMIIPLGWIVTSSGTPPPVAGVPTGTFLVQQRAYDHIVNTNAMSIATSCGMGSYRGDWDADSLSGQTFYPGDFFSRNTTSLGVDYTFIYVADTLIYDSTNLADFSILIKARSQP